MRFDRRDLVKVLAFVLVTTALSALVVSRLGGLRLGSEVGYRAEFRDVSGLRTGSQVRAAGVAVGTVDDIRLTADHHAEVTFSVRPDVELQRSVRATVRYANLTGDRYLDLTRGGDATVLEPGGLIPLDQTAPALDLDALFGGFRPLFQAIDPEQVNELSGALIDVFQGQSATVNSLLAKVAAVTSTVGRRDQLVGSVIDNLNLVLGTFDRHRPELGETVDRLQQLVSGLAADRKAIGASLLGVTELAGTTTALLRDIRPDLRANLLQLGRLSRTYSAEAGLVDHYLRRAPDVIQLLGRGGAYGSFFNFYVCGSRLKLSGPDGVPTYTEFSLSKEPRCQAGR